MSRRTGASVVAAGLLVVLLVVGALVSVPYVTMSPGPTINVLGKEHGAPIVQVRGHRTFRDQGQLRMVTVSLTSPDRHVGLAGAMAAWFDGTEAVYPRDVIYPPTESAQTAVEQSSVQMVGSQDTAVAAALTQLGYHLTVVPEVLAITPNGPSVGKLRPHDRLVRVNGTKITDVSQVSKQIQRTGVGAPAHFVVRRNGKLRHVAVTAKLERGKHPRAIVGIEVGNGYRFPFDVSVNIPEQIGGPSAGLMFSLGIYDTLTPGSLTRGREVAGTGTITAHGKVGPIGGIAQKIVAAADAGATMFLVPPGNCGSALTADVKPREIRLVEAKTMASAIRSVARYAKHPSARLPTCGSR